MACKWAFKKEVSLPNKKVLAKLVQFYVWETPVPGVSQKGKTLSEYGWKDGRLLRLQAEMRKVSGFPDAKGKRWISTTMKNVEENLRILGRLDNYDCSFEFAVHTVRSDLNKTSALFYFIRNAFAHGGFRINKYNGEIYYALENRQNGELKGARNIQGTNAS